MLTHEIGLVQMVAASATTEVDDSNLPWEALMWGSVSAVSLPIGAILGVYLSPVNELHVANTIAFGAGALLFAVTIELYGEQLHHIEADGFQRGKIEMSVCLLAAITGSIFYLYLNRWVEGDEEGSIDHFGGTQHGEDRAARSAEGTLRGATKALEAARKFKEKLKTAGIGKARFKALHQSQDDTSAKNQKLAMGMLVGIVADGIPEAILIGFLASDRRLSLMFVVSLFVANFPESFSSGSLMHANKTFSDTKIVVLWSIPMVLTGVLSALACWLVPPWAHSTYTVKMISAVIEGLAGGMMLAMIASVMLPHAYTMAKEAHELHRGDVPGVLCVCGFLCAVAMKVMGGYVEEAQKIAEEEMHGLQDKLDAPLHFFF